MREVSLVTRSICTECAREIELKGEAVFCPFCGEKLKDISVSKPSLSRDVGDTISNIWGEGAARKKSFSELSSRCVTDINQAAVKALDDLLPKTTFDYEEKYRIITQIGDRKTLLLHIQHLITEIGNSIHAVQDGDIDEMTRKCSDIITEYRLRAKRLCSLIGMPYGDAQIKETLLTIDCPREQLQQLYDQVLIAHKKYARCVQENNMFAAFSSTSGYGVIPDRYRYGILHLLIKKLEPEDHQEILPTCEEVITEITQKNTMPYHGLLDEDFSPHVDAFWYALEHLCRFFNSRIKLVEGIDVLPFSEKKRRSMDRHIMAHEFSPSESLFDDVEQVCEECETEPPKQDE